MIINIIDLFTSSINDELKYNIIFGAGKEGIALAQELINKNISVDYFCDNDKVKKKQKSII